MIVSLEAREVLTNKNNGVCGGARREEGQKSEKIGSVVSFFGLTVDLFRDVDKNTRRSPAPRSLKSPQHASRRATQNTSREQQQKAQPKEEQQKEKSLLPSHRL